MQRPGKRKTWVLPFHHQTEEAAIVFSLNTFGVGWGGGATLVLVVWGYFCFVVVVDF